MRTKLILSFLNELGGREGGIPQRKNWKRVRHFNFFFFFSFLEQNYQIPTQKKIFVNISEIRCFIFSFYSTPTRKFKKLQIPQSNNFFSFLPPASHKIARILTLHFCFTRKYFFLSFSLSFFFLPLQEARNLQTQRMKS